ncbi:MAG: penicillin-binding protein 1C, partial [Fulvivirga sp.]|nr:penicillin-binding protein 1C [Fulvivirga sp.]
MEKLKTIKRKHYLLMLLFIVSIWFYFCLPESLFHAPYSTVINDKNGVLLGASIAADEQWRFPTADSVPGKFEHAILYFEDEYFYQHPGVNPVSLLKAFYQNMVAGKVVRGGSTLSMQVIRLSRKGKARTYLEKLYECVLALRLELRHSKNEILNLYAAHAPFGGNVVGLEAAAWRYYNRPAHKLSWGETAALAVLPNAPALIYPGKNKETLEAKRNLLIDKLVENKVLSPMDGDLAKAEPLPGAPLPLPEVAPHVLSNYKLSTKKGLQVNTTLVENIQKEVQRLMQIHAARLKHNQIHNGAILVADTKSGAVSAYIGNTVDKQMRYENAVDIIQAKRSSGSTLKPFLYAKMQESGQLLPKTLLPDIPTYISGYAPKNFDEKFDGAVPADQALARSLNVPAVRSLQKYGVEIFHHDLKQLGFSTITRPADNYGLSLILGGAEVTLWELVENYRKMALKVMDFHHPQDTIYNIFLSDEEKQPMHKISLSASASWLTLEALKSMDRPMEGTQWKMYQSAKNIAWKTGTSFGHKDAWAIGVTPDYVVGVWVGNADGEGRPGLTGTATAAPILFDVFKNLAGRSWFKKPEAEMVAMTVCKKSGYKASQICDDVETLDVTQQAYRTGVCSYHKHIYLDKFGRHRVNGDCYRVSEMIRKSWFVLPPVMEWYYSA